MFTNNKTFLISDAYSITLANSWYFVNCYIAMSYYLTALYRYIFDNHLANGRKIQTFGLFSIHFIFICT